MMELTVGTAIAVVIIGVGLLHIMGKTRKNLFLFKAKKDVIKTTGFAVAGLGVLAILGVGFVGSIPLLGGLLTNTKPLSLGDVDFGIDAPAVALSCPDDGDSSFIVTVHNIANLTGDETFDVAYSLFDSGGGKVLEGTDTTDPTAVTIDCGQSYVMKLQVTDGASGDNSRVVKILSGSDFANINSDGDLVFTAAKSNLNIDLGAEQQATLQARLFDNNQGAFVIDSSDASGTDYETDGVLFKSTTDNETPMDETLGLDLSFQLQAVQSDTNWNDKGIYYLIESPVSVWDAPSVRVNGQTLSDVKGSSTVFGPDEQRAWSAYEYVYFTDDVNIYDAGEIAEVDVNQGVLSGQTCSADWELDIGARGNYESSNGIDVKEGGAQDNTAATVVRSLFDMTVDCTA